MNARGLLKVKMLLSIVTASALIVLSACGGTVSESSQTTQKPAAVKPKEKTKLKVLGFGSWFKEGMDAVLKDASEKMGIELEIEKVPEGDDGVKLVRTRFATKDLPDILLWSAGLTESQNLGIPSETFVSQDDQPWISNFDKNSWKGAMDSEDGLFYGAPYGGMNSAVVLYNKKVFEGLELQVPKTLEEFWSVSEKIKKSGKIPVYLSGKDSWTLQLPPFMAQARPGLSEFFKKVNVNQAKLSDWSDQKRGLVFIQDVIAKGYVNKEFLSDSYDNAQKALADGDAGMYLMATWVMADISKKYPDKVNDIGAFIMPFEGNGADRVGLFAPNSMYIVKGKNQDAAQQFVNYFESIDTQNIYFANEGGIPAIKGVTVTKLTPAEIEAQKLIDSGRASAVYSISKYAWDSDFGSLTQGLAAGGKSPEQVQESIWNTFVKNAKSKDDPNFK
ncbi:MAG TPA: ABC transporter substrate-binding protein [Bacilli bacterium]